MAKMEYWGVKKSLGEEKNPSMHQCSLFIFPTKMKMEK
jgi:hypothetical protein